MECLKNGATNCKCPERVVDRVNGSEAQLEHLEVPKDMGIRVLMFLCSNRAPIGDNNLGDFVFFLFSKVFYGILGVYIIPKWLINDS